MSFPSKKFEGFYRNSIFEVAEFFEKKHPGHYMMYNYYL